MTYGVASEWRKLFNMVLWRGWGAQVLKQNTEDHLSGMVRSGRHVSECAGLGCAGCLQTDMSVHPHRRRRGLRAVEEQVKWTGGSDQLLRSRQELQ